MTITGDINNINMQLYVSPKGSMKHITVAAIAIIPNSWELTKRVLFLYINTPSGKEYKTRPRPIARSRQCGPPNKPAPDIVEKTSEAPARITIVHNIRVVMNLKNSAYSAFTQNSSINDQDGPFSGAMASDVAEGRAGRKRSAANEDIAISVEESSCEPAKNRMNCRSKPIHKPRA